MVIVLFIIYGVKVDLLKMEEFDFVDIKDILLIIVLIDVEGKYYVSIGIDFEVLMEVFDVVVVIKL